MAERLKDLRTLQTSNPVRTLEAKRGPLIYQVKPSPTIKACLYMWYDTMYLPEHSGNIEDKVGAQSKAFAVTNPDEGRDIKQGC